MAENLQVSTQCRSCAPCKVAEMEVEYKWPAESVKDRKILGKLKAQVICPPICVCNAYECVSLSAKGRKNSVVFPMKISIKSGLSAASFYNDHDSDLLVYQ